jgi:hypothetical protein
VETERTALLIRCSREEADKIRKAAKRERRTVSGYVLNAVLRRIVYLEHIQRPFSGSRGLTPVDGGSKRNRSHHDFKLPDGRQTAS